MAYPAGVNFFQTAQVIGSQPISETSTTKRHELGTIVTAKDVNYGAGEFIYLQGVASTAMGDAVCFDQKAATTVRAVAGGASSSGPVGVAMSANIASQYGWYAIAGSVPANAATAVGDTQAHLTATAGQIDDATGTPITGMLIKAATAAGFATVQLARPSVSPEASGTNSGDVTLGAFGATPDAKGASLSAQVLTLQPADATHPGLVSADAQTLGGVKTFTEVVSPSFHFVAGANGGMSISSTETNIYAPNIGGEIHFLGLGGTEWARVGISGLTLDQASTRKITYSYTNNAATPGDTAINKISGRGAIALGAQACVVSNTNVTANSVIGVHLETPAAGVANVIVTAQSAGTSFTVKSVNGTGALTNTTAAATFTFVIDN